MASNKSGIQVACVRGRVKVIALLEELEIRDVVVI